MRNAAELEGKAMLNRTPIASAKARQSQRLLTSCAIGLALVAMGRAQAVQAQVLGTGVPVSGASAPANFGSSTAVSVTAPTAIINWTPTDNATNANAPIDFLNAGSSLSFNGSADFTVLNRILPTDTSRPIRIDGNVSSSIVSGSGGNIWFYTPGGMIIGGNARFNVGSLLLSANDIDTTGGLFGPGGEIRFRGTANSQAAIDVQPVIGGTYQVNLTNRNSYFALVAPRVSMAGGAFVNGSTAYVAAEQVDITINQGLFDISVLPGGGTSVTGANALSHTGNRGSGTPIDAADIQRTYMVAVPKNDAITMLVGGTLGHGATGVLVDNGAVILSGGYDIAGGIITDTPDSTIAVDMRLAGGDYFSDVIAHTTGALAAGPRPQSGDPALASDILFRTNATLIGDVSATVEANFGETVTALGSLTVRSGGIASVFADASTTEFGYGSNAGAIAVSGDLNIDASNTGAPNFATGGIGTAAVGGLAQLVIEGGAVTVTGDVEIRSNGIGGDGVGRGGDGTGGTASFAATDGIFSAATLTLDSGGLGGAGVDDAGAGNGGNGGAGRGGIARFVSTDSDFTFGTLLIGADGAGGIGGHAGEFDEFGYGIFTPGGGAGGSGGAGTGGTAFVEINSDESLSDLTINANGFGGTGGFGAIAGLGGNGLGGSGASGGAFLRLNDAALTVTNATIAADAVGGNGGTGYGGAGFVGIGGNGGNATGGSAGIVVTGAAAALTLAPPSLNPSLPNNARISATGLGGAGGSSAQATSGGPFNGPGGGNGGSGTGGTARFSITDGAAFAGANVGLVAEGFGGSATDGIAGPTGGAGGNAGAAIGGTAELALVNARLDRVTPASVNDPVEALDWTVSARAQGGIAGDGGDSVAAGATGGIAGTGGSATGGTAAIRTTSADFRLGAITLGARGSGTLAGLAGAGAVAPPAPLDGQGRGGTALVFNTDGGGLTGPGFRSIDTLAMNANGDLINGNGGTISTILGGTTAITDMASSPGGSVTIGSVTALSEGYLGGAIDPAKGFHLTSQGAPLNITGALTVRTGSDATVDVDGGGTLNVGGALSVTASGDIIVRHANVPAGSVATATITAPNMLFEALDDVTFAPGSILSSTGNIVVRALNGDIAAGELRGANLVSLTALGDITLGNAQVSGVVSAGSSGNPLGGRLELFAGRPSSGFGAFAPGNVTFTGAINTTGSIDVQAGGDIRVVTGANLVSNNLVRFQSGDDIIVETGASVGAASNPLPEFGYGSTGPQSTPGQLIFDAGAITTLAPISGNIPAIIIAGSVSAPNRAVTLNGGAIQADSNPIASRNFYATIRNAPAAGAAANADGGQLRSDCVAGNICLGTLSATNIVRIGPASGTFGLPNAVRFNGQINAADVTIRARDTITFAGQSALPVNIFGANTLFIATQTGNVILEDGTILNGGNVFNLYAGGAITGPGAALRSTGNMALFSGGALDLGSVDVGGALQTVDFNGTITNASALEIADSITIDDLIVRGGAVALIAGNTSAAPASTGDITITNLTTLGDASLRAANGSVVVSRDIDTGGVVTALARTITLATLGDVTIAQATATNGALGITAEGTATFQGIASGASVSVVSGDIVIGTAGRIGTAGTTQFLELRNGDAGRRSYIGGASTTNGYSLSADEMTRLFSNDITVRAPSFSAQGQTSVGSTRPPDVIVGAFTLNAGTNANGAPGNLGTNGTLRIETPGKLRVNGAVSLTGLGTGARFEIAGDDALEVINGAGSIDMRGANNALAGVLELSSDDIIVATQGAITDVGAATTTGAIDTRLALNDGLTSDDGVLRAGGIAVSVTGGFYVQNTGATSTATGAAQYDSRRGFTVGAGGLSIDTAGATSRIVINGRQVNPADGGFFTGLDFVSRVTINDQITGRTGFDAASTINGCIITATGSCVSFQEELPIPTRDVVEKPVNPDEDGFGNNLPTSIIELGDFENFGFEPLIDEPVTGAGNDDFWTPDCEPDANGNCAPPPKDP
ncbi:hypothetical protein [Sphingobium boeckii]|uniref:Filamentous hemagglutinin family protein n=1 Tax=Sphingobium boeckii TaxID=1082345 RepID=A0A7W9EE29_9SPHN|nr:hypothetical protein [Sphingobium boeckii]MBB5685848.1 filamentous hemagglutinin family protein [Sphingobium boeckii]